MATNYPISAAYADGQVLTAANVNQIATGVNDIAFLQTSTKTANYTLTINDDCYLFIFNSGTATTLSVPTNASVAFPVGTQILVLQYGTAQTTISAVTPATTKIWSNGSKTKTNGQYAVVCLLKIATDEWVMYGNTAT